MTLTPSFGGLSISYWVMCDARSQFLIFLASFSRCAVMILVNVCTLIAELRFCMSSSLEEAFGLETASFDIGVAVALRIGRGLRLR